MLKSYMRYKDESGGWGVPDFKEYKARLVPLRARRPWTDEDRSYVEALKDAGAGPALWTLLRGNPEARALLGGKTAPEMMPKKTLTAHIQSMIAASKHVGWGAAEFAEYVQFLDGGLRIRDLRGPTSQGVHVDNTDPFIEMYRSASEGVREHVRTLFRNVR